MIRQLLAIIDLITGLLLIIRPEFALVKTIGWFVLGKGVWSIVSSVAFGYFTDWMGMIDTLAGLSLILIHNGHPLAVMTFLGVVVLFKGIYSMV